MNRCGVMVSMLQAIFLLGVFLVILTSFGTAGAAPLNAYPWYVAANGDWCYRNPHRLGQLQLSPRPNNQPTLHRDATASYGMGVGNTASKNPQWINTPSVGATPAKSSYYNFFTGHQVPNYNSSPPLVASNKPPEESSDTVTSPASDLSAFASAASPNVVYYAPINYKGDAEHASYDDGIIPSQHQHKKPPIWPRSTKKGYGAYQQQPSSYHDSTSGSYSTEQSREYDESYEGGGDYGSYEKDGSYGSYEKDGSYGSYEKDGSYGSYEKDGSYGSTDHSLESDASDGNYASHESYGADDSDHHDRDGYAVNEVSMHVDHVGHSKAASAEESEALPAPDKAKEENNRPEGETHHDGKVAETGKQGKGQSQSGHVKPTTSITINDSLTSADSQGKKGSKALKPSSNSERDKPGTTNRHEAKTEEENKQKQHSANQPKEKKVKGQKELKVKEKAPNQNGSKENAKPPATFLATVDNDSSATTSATSANLTATTTALPISADQVLIQQELKLPDPGPKVRCEQKSALEKCSPIFKCEDDNERTGTCWREDNVDLTVFDDLTSSCKKVSALSECNRDSFCTGKTRGWYLVGGPCSQLAYFCDPNRFFADDDDESNTLSCHGHEIVHPRTKSDCVKAKEIQECASFHKIGTIV